VSDQLRLADLLSGLSIVADLGYGLPIEPALQSCLIGTDLARRMDLPEREVADVFYVSLLSLAVGRRLSMGVPQARVSSAMPSTKIEDVQKEHIRAMLVGCAWRIRGIGGVAERLGAKPTTLESRMARLGISRV
jgi:transcriptional regulator with GAF, ATPase, and Fis domain